MLPSSPGKKYAIVRSTPEEYPDYPYPECILGGWEALLTSDQRMVMEAAKTRRGWETLLDEDRRRVLEASKVDRDNEAGNTEVDERKISSSYTGFDALDADVQKMVRDKLAANKQWESEHGCLWFETPAPDILRSRRLWFLDRRRQVYQMIANNSYPVRTVIHRT